MQVGKVKFRKIWVASGAQGFFGEGYEFHNHLALVGLEPRFKGMTFTAKTATWPLNHGNMPLQEDFTPRDFHPDCIQVQWLRRNNLNAVGLSNPGFTRLLGTKRWQRMLDPFFLSFMPIAKTREARLEETRSFVAALKAELPNFLAPVGLQINLSCPNTEHDPRELLKEAYDILAIARILGIPIVIKLNALVVVEAARELSESPYCDAILVSNAIPFGQLPDSIPWKKIYGEKSPLSHYGGGGYTGKHLLPIVVDWIRRARKCGITKPINGGGGIHSLSDAVEVFAAGADGISLGSIAIHRSWRLAKIVTAVNGG